MLDELTGERVVRVMAREFWLLGARQTEVQSLYLELESGRWCRFGIDTTRCEWRGDWRSTAPPGSAPDDDAESRHPLVDVAAHYRIGPATIASVTTRRFGDLAELTIEFDDTSRLVAHYRPPPGASSLAYVTRHPSDAG
ncbi:MAG: hypothetical protein AB7O21_04145 [Gammaproteobacteria bacterium]